MVKGIYGKNQEQNKMRKIEVMKEIVNRIILMCTIIFISNICFSGSSIAFDDGDFQYWNSESATWKIDKDWKMRLEEEFKFGDNATDFYYQHSDLGIMYTGIGNWLDLGINYRLIFEEDDRDWDYENRPHYNAILKYKLGDLSFSNRNRFEHRFIEDSANKWRYRNKATIKLPKMTQLEIQPYIADEIFIDFEKDELDKNRLYGGVSMKIYKNLKGDIFYLWQTTDQGDDWLDYNVLGSKLKLAF